MTVPGARPGAGAGRPGDAEVNDPRAVVGQDDVARLEVAVDEAAGVDRGQPLGQRGTEPLGLRGAERAALGDRRRQRRPGHVGGDHPSTPHRHQ
jgi:hypothetical protein